MRRVVLLLAVCAGFAVLFVTASRPPGLTTRTFIEARTISFNPHARPVLKVEIRGGSCSFSLSARDAYLYECSTSGSGDPGARAVAQAQPLLRRHGLCVHTYVTLAGSQPLIYKCSQGLGVLALP